MTSHKGFNVNCKQCETCIFGGKSPIQPERFQELKQTWERDGVVQECHHATIKGQQIGCYGHYIRAKNGLLPHPLPGAWDEAFNIPHERMGSTSELFTICERMGLVHFVDIDSLTDESM